MLNRIFRGAAFALLLPVLASADNSLLFIEMQGVSGYLLRDSKTVYYSHMAGDVMQKPSAGFDYIRKFSTDNGDWGMAAVQARMAYDEGSNGNIQFQLYNAYLKKKNPGYDLWAGHDRPAFGLSSYLDSHGLLLQPLSMEGFGFDRDWGIGLYKVLDRGDAAVSLTTGSGMLFRTDGNYLISGRVSRGILEKDNYTFGMSASYGKILETMGYTLMNNDPVKSSLIGFDMSYLLNNYEFRAEACAGDHGGKNVSGVLCRAGVGLTDENHLKLELQPVMTDIGAGNYETNLYSGLSYVYSDSLTLRTMYSSNNKMIVGQLYWYFRV